MAPLGFYTKRGSLVMQHTPVPKCGLKVRNLFYGEIPNDAEECPRCLWEANNYEFVKERDSLSGRENQFPHMLRRWLRWPY